MDLLLRFRRLPPSERRTALAAILLLPLAAAGLRLLGYRSMLAVLAHTPRAAPAAGVDGLRSAAIVARVAEAIPGRPQCLVRSLVLGAILRFQGRNACLRIGVRRVNGALDAHAWVELDGSPLDDCDRVARGFLPLEAAGVDPLRA